MKGCVLKRLLYILALSLFSVSLCAQSDVFEKEFLKERGLEITEGNKVKLLKSGREKFADMLEAVRNAKSFIHLEYFNFRNDSIARLLYHELAEKVAEGVEVRAMYDAFGNMSNNQPVKRHMHDSIAALGIKLVKFDPVVFPWVNHILPRDHRKIVVIDGVVGYTGGMNVADYYVDGLVGIGPWRDMHLRVEGPAVARLHTIFCRMWQSATGESLTGEKYFPGQTVCGTSEVAVVDRHPGETNKAMRDLYVSMLDNAQTKVQIVNPYFVPTKSVRDALKRCIDRGVDVEIMISEKSDIPLTPDASHYVGRKMAKRGAKVYMFRGGFHHSKIMMVDDRFCTVGSTNLDSRSLRCDYEVNTVIFDREVTAELTDMFESDKRQCVLMDSDYWKRKSRWKRFVGWFGNLLTPIL